MKYIYCILNVCFLLINITQSQEVDLELLEMLNGIDKVEDEPLDIYDMFGEKSIDPPKIELEEDDPLG